MGARASKLQDISYLPGLFTNNTPRGSKARFIDGNRIRWHQGMIEKVGGWDRQSLLNYINTQIDSLNLITEAEDTLVTEDDIELITDGVHIENTGEYLGVCRSLHDWSSLDSRRWLALGTELKLYLVNASKLSDITPVRRTASLTNPFTTTNTSAVITVRDTRHGASTGNYIYIVNPIGVGGVTLAETYVVTSVTGLDTYTITAVDVATSSTTGGGAVTILYDIYHGLADNGRRRGYGTGPYGGSTYGTERASPYGVQTKLRTWSLGNWGEDLVASYRDGELYWWDKTLGNTSRAVLIATAPTSIQRMLVDDEYRRIILLGCTDLDGNADRMEIRWCSSEDLNDWEPTEDNTAGERRIDRGSRIITGIITRTQKLVWTDTTLYAMRAVSESDYGFDPLGTVRIAGPNALCDDNGTVFFMTDSGFYAYDGTLIPIDCDVWDTVFNQRNDTAIHLEQTDKTYCHTYQAKNEVTWLYQSKIGTEIDRYVTYNIAMRCWYFGSISRTAWHDASEFLFGHEKAPYAVSGGFIYEHETGTDEVEGSTTTAMDYHLQTNDVAPAGSDVNLILDAITWDIEDLDVGFQLTVRSKDRPRDLTYIEAGPYDVDEETTDTDIDLSGSQFHFLITPALDGNSAILVGQHFRMGVWQLSAIQDGSV